MKVGKFYRYVRNKKWWGAAQAAVEDGIPRLCLAREPSGILLAGQPALAHYYGEWQEYSVADRKPTVGEYYVPSLKSPIVKVLMEGEVPGRYARALVPDAYIHYIYDSGVVYKAVRLSAPGPLIICDYTGLPAEFPVQIDGKWYDSVNTDRVSRISALTGERHLNNLMTEVRGGWVERSRLNELPTCRSCGTRAIRLNPDFNDCDDCATSRASRRIRGYHQKPPHGLIFHKTKEEVLFLGAEIETEGKTGKSLTQALELLMRTDPGEQKFYLNRDGSLGSYGFEMITMPHSMEKFTEEKQYWTDLLEELRKVGMRAHDTQSCGQHVHVSRDALKPGAIEAIVAMYEANYPDFLHFSRRSQSELEQWARRYAASAGEARVKKGEYGLDQVGRHCAINRNNTTTIEFRMFKGTLNATTFFANLQLVWSMVLMANKAAVRERADSVTFDEIIAFSGFPEIKEYWEKRKGQKRERIVEEC